MEWLILDSSANSDDVRQASDFVVAARPPSLSLYFTCIRATTASFASDKGNTFQPTVTLWDHLLIYLVSFSRCVLPIACHL
jgi:hypothetical protein